MGNFSKMTISGGDSEKLSGLVAYRRCEAFRYVYEFRLSPEDVDKNPPWNPQVDLNPPFPAASALALADRFIGQVDKPPGFYWQRNALCLINIQGWMWEAKFSLHFLGFGRGATAQMICWILMDGTFIEPKVSKLTELRDIVDNMRFRDPER